MDRRLKYLNRLLAAYASGDFDRRLKLSDRLDDTDAVFSALHMMAEEIKTVTISRDYFTAIVNSVSDMVLVLSASGLIEDMNTAVEERLGYVRRGLIGRSVNVLTGEVRPLLWGLIRGRKGPDGLVRVWDQSFLTVRGDACPVELTARPLPLPRAKGKRSFLLMARDIGYRLGLDNRLLRAEIDGREMERKRLALDMHDGLGQRLTSARFLIGAAEREPDAQARGEKLQAAGELLSDMFSLIHEVCANLVSKTLEDFGLVHAIRELGDRLNRSKVLWVQVEERGKVPPLQSALEIDLFRVIQEFINNAIRHGEATWMRVDLRGSESEVELRLRENGKGFDLAHVQGLGMGLRNMHSRIRSHEGVFVLQSRPGKGTEARIQVSVNS